MSEIVHDKHRPAAENDEAVRQTEGGFFSSAAWGGLVCAATLAILENPLAAGIAGVGAIFLTYNAHGGVEPELAAENE
jgi:hypothetical protein